MNHYLLKIIVVINVLIIIFIGNLYSKNLFAVDNNFIPSLSPKMDEKKSSSSLKVAKVRKMEAEVSLSSKLASKQIDISSRFSGVLDFSSLDIKSNSMEDFWDLSKNFVITSYDLDSSNSYKTPLTLSRGVSLCLYYGCRFVVDTFMIPFYFMNYMESGFKEFPTSYLDIALSVIDPSNILEGEPLYIKDLGKKITWDQFKYTIVQKPVHRLYEETKDFSRDLLMKYLSKIDDRTDGSKRKNVYVFIANSPSTPIKIFLDSLKSQYSLIKNRNIKDSIENSLFIDVPYSLDLLDKESGISEQDLFNHFSKYVDPSVIEDNNLIFVDLAWDGVMIGSFMRNFKRYLVSSGVQEHELYADIHTFFPEGLRTNFLNELSTLPNMNVVYSNKYFSFLMKNVFFTKYDNTLLSFVDQKDSTEHSLSIVWNGSRYSPDVPYKWYRMNEERGWFFGNFAFYSLDPRNVSNKVRYPYSDYDEINPEYDGINLIYNYESNWKQTIKTNEQVSIMPIVTNLQKYYMDRIERDSSFIRGSLCSWIFQK